jgi:hypothetical protein
MKTFLPFALALSLAALALSSCSEESDLASFTRIVRIGDGKIPDYSDYGYNTAGAMYSYTAGSKSGTTPWTMNFGITLGNQRAYITSKEGNLEFTMVGVKAAPNEEVDLKFTFAQTLADSITSLQQLANLSPSCTAVVGGCLSVTANRDMQSSSTTLKFGRSRIIYGERGLMTGVSLAGTFAISGMVDTISVSLTDGRFDILFRNYDGNTFTSYDTSTSNTPTKNDTTKNDTSTR